MTARARWWPATEVARARLFVLVLLVAGVGWAVGLPVALSRPPSGAASAVLWVLVVLLAVALAAVLWAAVTPWTEPRTRRLLLAGLVLATLALWPAAHAWAEPGEYPWAWVAGLTAGVAPMVAGRPAALVAAGMIGAAALGALRWDQPVAAPVLITAGTAAVTVLMGQVVVWLLRLLIAAEAGRQAAADLAVTQDRLRVARELHDVLGNRLTVIALKAELIGELAGDPATADATATDTAATDRTRAEAEQIRDLAAGTLREVRSAVHGHGAIDLPGQLAAARLVLTSAGVHTELDVDPVGLAPAQEQLAAAVVREAVTNILRHSDARQVSIGLTRARDTATLVITNDRPRAAGGAPGMGLSGLADRCAQAGTRLRAGLAGDGFEVRVELVAAAGENPRR